MSANTRAHVAPEIAESTTANALPTQCHHHPDVHAPDSDHQTSSRFDALAYLISTIRGDSFRKGSKLNACETVAQEIEPTRLIPPDHPLRLVPKALPELGNVATSRQIQNWTDA